MNLKQFAPVLLSAASLAPSFANANILEILVKPHVDLSNAQCVIEYNTVENEFLLAQSKNVKAHDATIGFIEGVAEGMVALKKDYVLKSAYELNVEAQARPNGHLEPANELANAALGAYRKELKTDEGVYHFEFERNPFVRRTIGARYTTFLGHLSWTPLENRSTQAAFKVEISAGYFDFSVLDSVAAIRDRTLSKMKSAGVLAEVDASVYSRRLSRNCLSRDFLEASTSARAALTPVVEAIQRERGKAIEAIPLLENAICLRSVLDLRRPYDNEIDAKIENAKATAIEGLNRWRQENLNSSAISCQNPKTGSNFKALLKYCNSFFIGKEDRTGAYPIRTSCSVDGSVLACDYLGHAPGLERAPLLAMDLLRSTERERQVGFLRSEANLFGAGDLADRFPDCRWISAKEEFDSLISKVLLYPTPRDFK